MARKRHSDDSSGVVAILQPSNKPATDTPPWRWLLLAAAVHGLVVLVGPAGQGKSPADWLGLLRNVLVVAVLPLGMAFLAQKADQKGRQSEVRSDLVFPFVGLVVYAAIAGCWSDYPAAALKMLMYLSAFACVFYSYAILGRLVPQALVLLTAWFTASALALGSLQTFVLGNPFGSRPYRFTAFGAPQPFALGLAVLLGLTVYQARRRAIAPGPAIALLAIAVLGLDLCGGRQAFVAAIALCVLGSLPSRNETGPSLIWLPGAALLTSFALGACLQFGGPAHVAAMLKAHPPTALLFLSEADLQASGDAGTAKARAEIFRALWTRIRASDASEIVFGHGTSSSAVVIVAGDVRYRDYDESNVDPNRTAHNEFLRALFEWGLVGLVLLCALLFALLRPACAIVRNTKSIADLVLLATAGIALVGFSLLGNSLAAMNSPLGPSLCLLCAEIFRRDHELAT